MHYLHAILVNLEELVNRTSVDITKIKDSDIRAWAEQYTESYGDGKVFDWRETDTAGRWEGQYPNNVLRFKDNYEECKEILERKYKNQQGYLNNAMSGIAEYSKGKVTINSSLEDIIKYARDTEKYSMVIYELKKITDMIGDYYTTESEFYDTEQDSSTLNENRIAEILENANKYAIVLFDYHW